MLCEYGCGQEAIHQCKNGKWICAKHPNSCPSIRKQIRDKHKGKSKSEDHKRKQSETMKGRKHSEEHNKKISESITGEKNPFYGKKHSEETRKKLSELNSGKNHPNYGKIRSKHSKRMKGKKNPAWKGGYSLSNIPTYNEYHSKLTIDEKPERDNLDQNILTVVCSYSECKKRFIPALKDVQERIRALNGKNYGEHRLYCSDECKNKCPIFNKHTYQDNHPKNSIKKTDEKEYQIFRKLVLHRDSYICQFCGDKATDVHHERPQKLEPFFSLDPDYAWSCCEKCHYGKGHNDECSTGNLSKTNCK
jgi:hypothetical protein